MRHCLNSIKLTSTLYIIIIFTYCRIYMYYTVSFFVFLSFIFNYQTSFSLLSLFLDIETVIITFSPIPFRSRHPSPYNCPSSNRTNVKSGVSALSSTSTAFGTAASNQRLEHTGNGHIDETLRQQALAEEEAAMNQYKVRFLRQNNI